MTPANASFLLKAGTLLTADGTLPAPRLQLSLDGLLLSLEYGNAYPDPTPSTPNSKLNPTPGAGPNPAPSGDLSPEPNAAHHRNPLHDTTLLAPAFVDIHTHGALGHDVMSATPAEFSVMARFLATRGVAHFLPTTVTAPVETTLRALERLADAVERSTVPGNAQLFGIHLEGPFLSHAKRGVHPTAELQKPSVELFGRFQQAARGHILLLTVAPELPGALELIRYAVEAGIRASVGHTDATFEQVEAAVSAGATSATHTFNAMRGLDHREPGALGAVLSDDRLYAELIADGVHVAPAAMELWLRAKGPTRGILVTDAMSATGCGPGAYTLGGLPVTVTGDRALLAGDLAIGKHTLAGSILTMDHAVANLHRLTGASVATAARLATYTPATLLDRPDLVALTPGTPASLVRLDHQGHLLESWIGGQHQRPT